MLDGLPEPGDLIADKYVVDRVLGRGGMGTVFGVVHRETGKRLALKCLLPTYVSNPSVVERFIREAKAVGRIQHRHVIDIFDQGRDGSVLYMVLPLLEGKPLSELLYDEHLTLEEALLILVRAMEGVAAANALGVLHRDLKPTNIFVCMGVSGRLDDPRVLDFGISKLDDELEQPLTRSGVAVGTPYYMPLEQLTGQRDLDARVDVYAMGVILYEAISGVVPHVADNVAALALRLMHTPPVHLSSRRPDLPAGLAAVIMRALARDRDDRYPTMRALIEAITPFIPESARLTVSAPKGIRLRTPRDTGEPAAAEDIARATATTQAATVEPRQAATPASTATPAPPDATPAPAQASLKPPSGSKTLLRVAIPAAVAAGVVVLVASQAPTGQAPAPAERPPDRVAGAHATAASDAALPVEPTLAEPARPPAPAQPPDASSATSQAQAPAPSPPPHARATKPAPTRRRPAPAPAASQQPAPSQLAQPRPLPDKPEASEAAQSVETRAGALAPEEF